LEPRSPVASWPANPLLAVNSEGEGDAEIPVLQEGANPLIAAPAPAIPTEESSGRERGEGGEDEDTEEFETAIFADAGFTRLALEHLFSFTVTKSRASAKGKKRVLQVSFRGRYIATSDKGQMTSIYSFRDVAACAQSGYEQGSEVLRVSMIEEGKSTVEWVLGVENAAERQCLSHLLSCVACNLSGREAVATGERVFTAGLDAGVLAQGVVVRKARFRSVRRLCVLVPGKLLLFAFAAGPDSRAGPRGRVVYAASLHGASGAVNTTAAAAELVVRFGGSQDREPLVLALADVPAGLSPTEQSVEIERSWLAPLIRASW